uniref:Odorant-binding protein 36 n=1 Tax=Encarsia formosa TaxID=32400 RepID=A0A514TTZ6_ENCFO|nr:odorant-binding protein 36 [Encarsia formosa]
MRVIVAAVLVVCSIAKLSQASTLANEQKAKLREYKELCIAESGVDTALLDSIKNGGAVTRDTKLDCFSSCLLQKIGVQRADGTIDRDRVIEKAKTSNADLAKVNDVIEKCKGLGGKDACEIGGNVLGCFIKEKTLYPYWTENTQ